MTVGKYRGIKGTSREILGNQWHQRGNIGEPRTPPGHNKEILMKQEHREATAGNSGEIPDNQGHKQENTTESRAPAGTIRESRAPVATGREVHRGIESTAEEVSENQGRW